MGQPNMVNVVLVLLAIVALVNFFAIRLFRHVRALDELMERTADLPSSFDDNMMAPAQPRRLYLA